MAASFIKKSDGGFYLRLTGSTTDVKFAAVSEAGNTYTFFINDVPYISKPYNDSDGATQYTFYTSSANPVPSGTPGQPSPILDNTRFPGTEITHTFPGSGTRDYSLALDSSTPSQFYLGGESLTWGGYAYPGDGYISNPLAVGVKVPSFEISSLDYNFSAISFQNCVAYPRWTRALSVPSIAAESVWSNFMKTYAVWPNPGYLDIQGVDIQSNGSCSINLIDKQLTLSQSFAVPETGLYKLEVQGDNNVRVYIFDLNNNIQILPSVPPPGGLYSNNFSLNTPKSVTVNLTANIDYFLTAYTTNSTNNPLPDTWDTNPGGVAWRIRGPIINNTYKGIWKNSGNIFIKQGGSWKEVQTIWVKKNGSWQKSFQNFGNSSWINMLEGLDDPIDFGIQVIALN